MPGETESIQRYFPLIKSNAEKLLIASTLDALVEKGYLPEAPLKLLLLVICFSKRTE